MSDTIVVMNQGYIQQVGTPEDIYNEPKNAFVADFIGDSNILSATMVHDRLVNILGANFPCVDEGFGQKKPVDAVIRPEDIDLVNQKTELSEALLHMLFSKVFTMRWKSWQIITNGSCTAPICSQSEQKSDCA